MIEPWNFDALVKCVRAALDAEPGPDGVAWSGPQLTAAMLSGCSNRAALSREWLDIDAGHGRDKTDVVIGIAIRLGIEQGLRVLAEQGETQAMLAERHIAPEAREWICEWIRNPGRVKEQVWPR